MTTARRSKQRQDDLLRRALALGEVRPETAEALLGVDDLRGVDVLRVDAFTLCERGEDRGSSRSPRATTASCARGVSSRNTAIDSVIERSSCVDASMAVWKAGQSRLALLRTDAPARGRRSTARGPADA